MPADIRAGGALVIPEPRPDARLRLVMFPYAGAGASAYFDWSRRLEPWVEGVAVQLPGRESRIVAPLMRSVPAIAASLVAALAAIDDKPFAFFGHSFGALVAYETACLCAENGVRAPFALALSGRSAAHRTGSRPPVAELPREAFFDHLRSLGGMPTEVFAHPDLLDFFEPILRADLAANEAYRHPPRPRLAVPLLALAGRDDESFPAAEVARWGDLTSGEVALRVFDGGHFFINSRRDEVLQAVHALLASPALLAAA